MATLVLVHGGFCGGWIWKPVRDVLQALGHTVFTPTLTGLGDRVHLANPGIDLDVHAEDVLNLLRFENLHDVVMVAHSYGGIILSLVSDRMPERLVRRIYVDAVVLESGESLLEPNRGVPEGPATLRQLAAANKGFLPPPTTTSGPAGAIVGALLRPQPFGTFEQAITLSGRGDHLPTTYITCLERPPSEVPIPKFTAAGFKQSRERAKARGWEHLEDQSSHFSILAEHAERLARIIAARV